MATKKVVDQFLHVEGAALRRIQTAAAKLKTTSFFHNPIVGRSREKYYYIDSETFKTLTALATMYSGEM